MERRVPQWKVKWCKENLRHMITRDDVEVSLSKSKTNASLVKKKSTIKGRKQTAKKIEKIKSLAASIVGEESDDEDDVNLE